jgi:subtilase family serine protease
MRALSRSLAFVVASLVVGLFAAPLASAATYAKAKFICKAAAPHHMGCFVIERVNVKAGTPGATAFTLAPANAGAVKTQGPAGGLTPADLQTAYGLTSAASADGSGNTIALVDAFNDPNIQKDLVTFDKEYGLPAPPSFKVLNQSGATSPLPPNDTSGWSVEESLDVDSAHSVCPKCNIDLIETKDDTNPNLEAGVNEAAKLKVNEISNSYGGPETGTTSTDRAAYNHPGIVITASAGDQGWYDYEYDLAGEGPINEPNYPASDPNVISVGGTSLFFTQTGAYKYENVWQDDGPRGAIALQTGEQWGATGSGCSTLLSAASWQLSAANWKATGCGTKRLSNDISAVGDEFTGFDLYDSYNCLAGCSGAAPGWATVGGTSLSSPVIAATFGLAGGAHGVSYPAKTLYSHPTLFHDVTVGGSGICDGQGAPECGNWNNLGEGAMDCGYNTNGTAVATATDQCDAVAKFDGPSGLGTPDGITAFQP